MAGALGWAYVISERPETAFYGHPSTGRSGDGGWILLGTTMAGVGVGLATSRIPALRDLGRAQVALLDLGGLFGGVLGGALGVGIGYGQTGSWTDTARIAVPTTVAGIGVAWSAPALACTFCDGKLRRQAAQSGPQWLSDEPSLLAASADAPARP